MNNNDNILPTNPEEANDLFDQQEELDDHHEMVREMDEREDQFRDDAEADADALASAGWGTDEDYNGGCFNDME